jgi:hypothetical protein
MDRRPFKGRYDTAEFNPKKKGANVVRRAEPGTIIVASVESPRLIEELTEGGAEELLRAGTRKLYKKKSALIGDPKLVVLRR